METWGFVGMGSIEEFWVGYGNKDDDVDFDLDVNEGLEWWMKEDLVIYILLVFKIVVPFRRPHYRTSHCYSELSGDYWDKLSHPTITDIFAGIHAQAQTSGKGIR